MEIYLFPGAAQNSADLGGLRSKNLFSHSSEGLTGVK